MIIIYFKNRAIVIISLILLIVTLPGQVSLARFNHYDADLIDQEERSNTETYNDKNSYRYPRSWIDQWHEAQFGYRSSAGSLNVSRFLYDEDIKINPSPLAKFTASFVQSRREDLTQQTQNREIRLGWAFMPGARLSILGDGDTFKEFGDMGVALTLRESDQSRFDVYYWNVDNYYKSKKSDVNAYRLVDSHTMGLFFEKKNTNKLNPQAILRIEYDSPLEWYYPAKGFEYEYWRKIFELNLEWPLSSDVTVYVDTLQEQKMEKKIFLSDSEAFKHMLKRTSEVELGFDNKLSSGVNYTVGLQNILRHVDYSNGSLSAESPLWRESLSPEKVRRLEWGVIMTRHAPVSDGLSIQHGFYANDVLVREDAREWKVWELKYQLLLDITLNPHARLGINTTWDLDQVARDYPYSKKAPFRPWGGGDLQFLMRI
jgi:hypothetical protein